MSDLRSRVLLSVVAAALSIAGLSLAATLEVDDSGGTPYTTIQGAIDAATSGSDDVFVRCGTYIETITMREGVPVRGEDPNCVIVDAGEAGPVVTMTDLSSATTLQGVTVRHASPTADGAIVVQSGSPVITRTIIRDSLTRGIAVNGTYGQAGLTAPQITHNIITANDASDGSAIRIMDSSGARITNNLIVSNGGVASGGTFFGYGLYEAVITNNTIANNGAIGLRVVYGDADVANNLLFSNVGGDYGAVYFYGTFRNNSGGVPGSIGGPPDLADERIAFDGFRPRSDSILVDAGADEASASHDLRGVGRPIWTGSPDWWTVPAPHTDVGAQEATGMTGVRFTSNERMEWDGCHPNACTWYRAWRGDLQALRQTGAYTQDPDVIPGAWLICQTQFPFLTDSDLPLAGQTLFYLVHAVDETDSDAEGGSLGLTSDLSRRPITRNCYTGY